MVDTFNVRNDTYAALGFTLTAAEIDQFWSRVNLPDDLDNPAPCWMYRPDAPGDRGRYGHVRIRVAGGHRIFIHRLALALCGGVLTEQQPIATHSCHTPACVSGRFHVRSGTYKSNAEDRDRAARRTPFLLRGEDAPGAKLTDREVEAMRRARALGVPAKTLAEAFDVSLATVYGRVAGPAAGRTAEVAAG